MAKHSRMVLTLARTATAGLAIAFLTASAPLPGEAAPQMPSPTQRLPKPRPKPKSSKPSSGDDRPAPATEVSDEKPAPAAEKPKAAPAPRTWLDAPVKNWNTAGAPLPRPVKGEGEFGMDDRCKASLRTGNAPEDAQLTGAGWFLFGPRQTFNDVTLVSATAGADGMCRPMGHQTFLFVNGTFAGTIAPQPMASRFDGDADRLYLYSADSLTVEFRRYAPSDPLCCPSGRASVSYAIDRKGAGALLVPVSITPESK